MVFGFVDDWECGLKRKVLILFLSLLGAEPLVTIWPCRQVDKGKKCGLERENLGHLNLDLPLTSVGRYETRDTRHSRNR